MNMYLYSNEYSIVKNKQFNEEDDCFDLFLVRHDPEHSLNDVFTFFVGETEYSAMVARIISRNAQDFSNDDLLQIIPIEVVDQYSTARKYDTVNEYYQTWSDELSDYVAQENLLNESFRSLVISRYGECIWSKNKSLFVLTLSVKRV